MRVFVYEFTCGGAGGEEQARGGNPAGLPVSSLRAEGWAMLSAVLDDLNLIPGVQAVTIPDPAGFREAAAAADWALVIAPEFDRILETRCRWVEEVGGRLLGPSSDVVALTADKLALGRYLDRVGVPTPPVQPLLSSLASPSAATVVSKPRFGAGSQETYVESGDGAFMRLMPPGPAGEMIVQPFVRGRPASVAFLIGPSQTVALCPTEQQLSDDGRLRYLGGRAPLLAGLAGRAERIARRAIDAVAGLRGYVGVDVVLGDDGRDWVIEINPRLTTSYVGLRALAAGNLMAMLLLVVQGRPVEAPAWRPGEVCWTADGTVTGP